MPDLDFSTVLKYYFVAIDACASQGLPPQSTVLNLLLALTCKPAQGRTAGTTSHRNGHHLPEEDGPFKPQQQHDAPAGSSSAFLRAYQQELERVRRAVLCGMEELWNGVLAAGQHVGTMHQQHVGACGARHTTAAASAKGSAATGAAAAAATATGAAAGNQAAAASQMAALIQNCDEIGEWKIQFDAMHCIWCSRRVEELLC